MGCPISEFTPTSGDAGIVKMATQFFLDAYSAAVERDCSLIRTVTDLREEFSVSPFLGLVPLAKSLYDARVEFIDAIDSTDAGRRARSRGLTTSCPRCGDKYCANAQLVQIISSSSGK